MRFTREEFDAMVSDLLYSDPVSYDTLCQIAKKTLWPSVIRWCQEERCLCGRGYEEDVMHNIYLRLIQTTIDYFLLRDGIEDPYNNDPEGFEDWMFRVAINQKKDFANAVRNRDIHTENGVIPPRIGGGEDDDSDAQLRIERLAQAFDIVLSSDLSVYKILTWLAQFVFVLRMDITKIESADMIVATFENKTLFEMYEMIMVASERIPWIVMNEKQNEKMLSALRKKRTDDVLFGETKYKEFFMKHNGEVSGKKSVSDWVHRINDMIKKSVGLKDGSSKQKTKKPTSQQEKDNKKEGGDEASDC